MKEFFISLLLGTIEQLEETALIAILQNLHDKDLEKYKAAIYGGAALVGALLPLVQKTKTNLDDVVLRGLQDAINQSAQNNGINLNVPVTIMPTAEVEAMLKKG